MVCAVAALAGGGPSAHAQAVQRIAAIVNDDIVSVFDLRSRMKVVMRSAGLNPTPELQRRLAGQVLRTLIDERLQLQEARRRNVRVTQSNMKAAIAQIEQRNRIPAGKFEQFLEHEGVPKDSAMAQIRAQVSWAKLVGRVLNPRVVIGEDEIEEELARLKSRRGQIEYRLSEVLLVPDRPEDAADVRRTAARLIQELRKGAEFSAVANQFSRGATASVGGDLGWIVQGALESDLRPIVAKMAPGDIAGPIETQSGIHILRLRNRRRAMAAPADKTVVDLRQLVLPLSGKPGQDEVRSQTKLASLMGDTIRGCDDIVRAAKEAGSVADPKLGKVKLSDLSAKIRGAIAGLPDGSPSKPVRVSSGIALFMVCDRKEPEIKLPDRQAIANRLRISRLEIMARRFMRDLRNAAIIDLRV